MVSVIDSPSEHRDEYPFFPGTLKDDPHHALDGRLVLKCIFCKKFKTPIEFDMGNHVLGEHEEDLPLDGMGLEYRIGVAIEEMKQRRPREFYEHRTAKFAYW
jgi:hypothetical protein